MSTAPPEHGQPLERTGPRLPDQFRKLPLEQRREALRQSCRPAEEEWDSLCSGQRLLDLADLMVESAVGCLPVPVGVATGFLIDGEELSIPMAVEEPSVVAAASFAAGLVRQGGGFVTSATEPVMSTQLFVDGVPEAGLDAVRAREGEIRQLVDSSQPGMKRRGGGYRGLELTILPETGILRVDVLIDVRDAMGANVLNTVAESLRQPVESWSGGRCLMCILSNAARRRRGRAQFSLPVDRLRRIGGGRFGAEEVARRVVRAGELARDDEERAVTHNKGIMNGISSLALATMNDTRAIEAAAHAWAARDGRYRGLSEYSLNGNRLEGRLELPLSFGTVGGSVSFHPASRLALRILGNPDSRRLARIAAALGLAQNLAAVLALVTGGIQRGHMKYHAARLAYTAGARGQEIRAVAEELGREMVFTAAEAGEVLRRLRAGSGG
ncbi:MAG: hydroxymethylglutaryl-CoA reductase, degradative [Spirochaetales bacterium]|nr:hydroxymethylglutaryl-CoA reductase, degradative [Spirochaetales bacterium]